jgi:2'-5' RNA ligase
MYGKRPLIASFYGKKMDNQEKMRLFVAIEAPLAVIEEVQTIQKLIKRQGIVEATYTQSNGMHITLKFLGNVAAEHMRDIDVALRTIQFSAMQAQLGSLDFFFHRRHPKILFLNVLCPQLAVLAKAIDQVVAPFVAPESRDFVSHLTLARIKKTNDLELLKKVVEEYKPKPLAFTISQFVLKQSELTAQGAVYADLMHYQLL